MYMKSEKNTEIKIRDVICVLNRSETRCEPGESVFLVTGRLSHSFLSEQTEVSVFTNITMKSVSRSGSAPEFHPVTHM